MNQIIFRIHEKSSDAQVLQIDGNNEYFRAESIVSIRDKLNHYIERTAGEKDGKFKDVRFINSPQIIAMSKEIIVINQEEHERYVTYDSKAYKVHFPNSIYIMSIQGKNRIKNIEAYSYKEYKGKNTELFKYPMPNMLTGASICIGTAPREVEGNDFIRALERIIFTQYTHARVDDIKSFQSTEKYFTYIQDNAFPYDLLIPSGKKLFELFGDDF